MHKTDVEADTRIDETESDSYLDQLARKVSSVSNDDPPNPLFWIPLPFVIVFLIVNIIQMFHSIQPGHIGIKTRLGKLVLEPLPEGMNIVNPFFDNVYQMDIKIQEVGVTCQASSGDLQQVETSVSVQYYVAESLAPLLYKQVGTRDEMQRSILEPAMQEGVKAVTSTFTADELITRRDIVKLSIKQAITSFNDITLETKSLNAAIRIANVAITNFKFSLIFNEAIESKVEAEQEALQAENEKLTTITNAQAQAGQKMLSADALAYKINATANARANAIIAEAAALVNNPELITLRKIERWNGWLPKFESSEANGSFSAHINSLEEASEE